MCIYTVECGEKCRTKGCVIYKGAKLRLHREIKLFFAICCLELINFNAKVCFHILAKIENELNFR